MTGRILVVDAIPTNRIVMRVKLNAAFYETALAGTAAAAQQAVMRHRPDLVILAANLPDMPVRALCEKLRRGGAATRLPVMVIANDADPAERLGYLAAGADDVLERPIDDMVMLARVRSLLRARDAEAELRLREDTRRALGLAEEPAEFQGPADVAVVALGDTDGKRLVNGLSDHLRDRVRLVPADDILRDPDPRPDVIVLSEGTAPGTEGLTLLPQIRAGTETRLSGLIYLTHPHLRQGAASALDMGADEMLLRTPSDEELALRVRRQIARKRTADKLRANMRDGLRAAVADPLTGLYNRRYAIPHLARIAERAEQRGRGYALLLADLDHFKQVNDRYGHAAGDEVLVALATRLKQNLRAADLIARYGGEEFLIAMPDTGRAAAKATAERLCQVMTDAPVTLEDGRTIAVTLSIGVALGEPGGPPPTRLIETADRALYAAKDKGRNTVVMADTVTPLQLLRPAPGAGPVTPRRAVRDI